MKVYSPSVIENLIVSGSSSFTGSLNIQGTVSASSITGTATTAETASYVEFASVDGLSSFSSSVDTRLAAQEDFSSSLDTTFATDAELSSLSSSVDTRVGTTESDITALDGRLDAVESFTSSIGTVIKTNLNENGVLSGSSQVQLSDVTGTTFATENFTFPQDLTVQGTLTAQEFHTELVSSSVIFDSGSTKFGDSADDIHSFTGSLNVVGNASASAFSGSFNGDGTALTNVTGSYVEFDNVQGLTSFSSSVDTRVGIAETDIDALETRAGLLESATSSLDARLDSVETTTSSLNTRVTDLENFSSSLDATFATDAELSSLSSSVDTRLGTAESDIDALESRAGLLESATASLDGRLDAVETTTSSLNTRVTDLENFSSSLDATFATDAEVSSLSSSLDTRISAQESFSSSLDATFATDAEVSALSSSLDTRIGTVESDINSVSSSFDTRVGIVESDLNSVSSSFDTRVGTAESDIDALETRAGLLESATSSLDARLDSVETTTASFGGRLDAIETVTSSLDTRVTDLESFSSSLDSEFATDAQLSAVSSSFDTRVGTVESDLNSVSSSFDTRVGTVESDLNSVSSSFDTRVGIAETDIDAVETRAGLLESATASLDGRLDAVETTTSSFSGRLDAIETTTSSLSGRVDSIESFTSSIDTTIKTKLNADGVVSSSAQIDVTGTTNYNLLPTLAGTNTLTGVNTFSNTTNSTAYTNGAVVVAGGVGIGKDLNVSGSVTINGLLTAVSTSFQYVTSSEYVIGTSRIYLNDDDNVRFAGVSIYDSGSASPATASILWDSLNHHFLYENISGAPYNSAIIIAGPKNTGTLGDEAELTTNRVPVASGGDHIDTDPSISPLRIDGGDFHVESDTVVTGSVSATTFSGTFAGGVVSASSQVNHDSTTGFVSDEHIAHSGVSITAGNGLTGGGTIAASRTINVASANNGITVNADNIELATASSTFTDGVKSKLNTDGVVSSSAQIDHDQTTNFSAAEHFTQANITTVGTVTAGSVTAILPSGVVSASSQVSHDSTTGFVSDEHVAHSTVSITAGSGLTGGGTIAATRTLAVGAGTGITVNADDVALTGQALALHNLATNGLIARTGAGTVAGRTLTAGTGIDVTNGDGVSGNPTVAVDVSDFMTNGSNNRVVTATGTDAMNAEANLTFDGSTLAVTGDITATGEVTAYFSDARLKNFHGTIENALDKINTLNGYYFTENEVAKSLGYNNDKMQIGVSAQEVQAVLPEIVTEAPIDTQYLTVKYEKIVPLLIEAIKELKAELDEVKKNCNTSSN